MKPLLLYREGDRQTLMPDNEPDITKDLNLGVIYAAMAHGDAYIRSVVSRVVPKSVSDPEIIRYRQAVYDECLHNRFVINRLYAIATDASENASAYREYTRPSYDKVVSSSAKLVKAVGLMEIIVAKLREIANMTQENTSFTSEGLYGFCMRVNTALNTGFFAGVQEVIERLKGAGEGKGLVADVRLGAGLKGAACTVRNAFGGTGSNILKKRIKIPLKDYMINASAKDAEEACYICLLREVNHFISAAQVFTNALRYELAFYIGCINLHVAMELLSLPDCRPEVFAPGGDEFSFAGLYDLSIALADKFAPVSNDLEAGGKRLLFVTGANQGGKSTFLRSVGIAYVLMQCGCVVPAASFSASLAEGVYTHFARREDADMEHGKLDEELVRMNDIVDRLEPHSLLLLNEALATTTEHDGALIAGAILSALYEYGVRVVYVTHLYELADTFFDRGLPGADFLRAQRLEGGGRSFKVMRGRPNETSYGEDLYEKIIEGK